MTFFAPLAFSDLLECNEAMKGLASHLSEIPHPAEHPTVRLEGMTPDGRVNLSVDEEERWNSTSSSPDSPYAIQGDPRMPIFFFGAKLAALFRFRIYTQGGRHHLLAPGAHLFASLIRDANSRLRAKSKEVISYLTVYDGFVSARRAMDLALDTDKDIFLKFVYAHDVVTLAAHEIAYHLGAILYPRKFFKRAYQINRHTEEFIKVITANNSKLGPVAFQIANQLLIDRSHELDRGTADIQAAITISKSKTPDLNYKQWWAIAKKNPFLMYELNLAVTYLSRPSMSPLTALSKRLSLMTDIRPVNVGAKNDLTTLLSEQGGLGKKVSLTPDEKEVLLNEINRYVYEHRDDDGNVEISAPETWIEDFVLGLDERIEDITEALTPH